MLRLGVWTRLSRYVCAYLEYLETYTTIKTDMASGDVVYAGTAPGKDLNGNPLCGADDEQVSAVSERITFEAWACVEGGVARPEGTAVCGLPMCPDLDPLHLPLSHCCFAFFNKAYSEPGRYFSISPWFYEVMEGDPYDAYGEPGFDCTGYRHPALVVDRVLMSLRANMYAPDADAADITCNDKGLCFPEILITARHSAGDYYLNLYVDFIDRSA